MNAILINRNQIEWETPNAYLIKIPGGKGYKFWYPKKLTQDIEKDKRLRLLILNDFEFKVFKNGQGKYNSREIISEKTIDPDAILELFGYNEEEVNPIIDLLDLED